MVGGKFLRKPAQGRRRDFRLMLENVIAERDAQLFRLAIEIASNHGGIVGPVVHGQREVVADDGDLVSAGSLFHQGSGAATVGALQVLKYYQGDLGSFWRPEGWIDVLGRSQRSYQQKGQSKYGARVLAILR